MKLYLSSFRLGDHTGVPYLPLRDGQALVINGDDRELV